MLKLTVVNFEIHKCNMLLIFYFFLRGKEIYKKKNDKKKMSTVYEDIDEYEMIVSNTHHI